MWKMNKSHRKGKCSKMQMWWIQQLMVLKRVNDVTYQVKMKEKEIKIIHCGLLKPCEA